jgi:hypothetical protein
MNLETVFHAEGSSTAEIEALEIKSLLEASGIPAVLVGDSVLPNLPIEIKVPANEANRALQLISASGRRSARALEPANMKAERNAGSASRNKRG